MVAEDVDERHAACARDGKDHEKRVWAAGEEGCDYGRAVMGGRRARAGDEGE